MIEYVQEITFEQARSMAEEAATEQLELFRTNENIPVLRELNKEAECCWFFFRNKQIEIPPGVLRGWAYAVSKKGKVILIADYSDEPKKLHEYLEDFSNHLKERGL